MMLAGEFLAPQATPAAERCCASFHCDATTSRGELGDATHGIRRSARPGLGVTWAARCLFFTRSLASGDKIGYPHVSIFYGGPMISRSCLHAIRALAHLARLEPGTFMGAARLGDAIDAPQNYLGKLLQTLSQEDLVVSRMGLGGGYGLARPAARIRLIDIAEPLDHVSRWDDCFLGHAVCSDQTACAVHERWASLRDEYVSLLRNTTIADIVQSGEPASLRRGGRRS